MIEKIEKTILAELRRQMNGAVSQTMRELGQTESLNLGVSLPTIKEIALQFAPNHALASKLSNRKMREAKIAALYLAEPETLTANEMEQWSQTWESEEIARLSAMLLFYKSTAWAGIARDWISAGDELHKLSALYIIGKNAGKADDQLIKQALELCRKSTDPAATFSLREIYHHKPEYRTEIAEIAESNSELRWQIEAL